MKRLVSFILSSILFCVIFPVSAQSQTFDDIRRLYKSAQLKAYSTGTTAQFYEKYFINGKPSGWVVSEDTNDNTSEIIKMLTTYSENGQVFMAILLENSIDGSWIKETEYYFYESGNTAFIVCTIVIFDSEYEYIYRYYFDDSTKLLEKKITSRTAGEEELPVEEIELPAEPTPDLIKTTSEIFSIL